MTIPVILDNIAHHDLRLIERFGADLGDNRNQMPVFPGEFCEIQREYPIFFRPATDGSFQPIALLGLSENLYLSGDKWQAHYIPALRQRGPLVIGTDDKDSPVTHIDLTHPRLSTTEGAPLFKPHGGQAPALERASRALHLIHQGTDLLPAMFAAFAQAQLLAPVHIELRLSDGSEFRLPELFTISPQGLSELTGTQLAELNADGFLALAFYVAGSAPNLQRLINMKNQQVSAL
ncbi:MAG: SapC family protein [Asticcacaulis sp.]